MNGWPSGTNSHGSYGGDCMCRECTADEEQLGAYWHSRLVFWLDANGHFRQAKRLARKYRLAY
jgi:hypothetical protein